MSTISYPRSNTPSFPVMARILVALMIGLMLFFGALIVLIGGYQYNYSGRIYQGVNIAGVDVSGQTPEQAALNLLQKLDYSQRGRIVLQDGSHIWTVTPGELGLVLDPVNTVEKAYLVGRSGNVLNQLSAQIDDLTQGTSVSPVVVLDQRAAQQYLLNLATQIDKPMVEASLELAGTDVVVKPGQLGRALDVNASLALVTAQLQKMQDGIIPLVIHESAPVILDASKQAEVARNILNQPLVLSLPSDVTQDAGPWTYNPEALVNMLMIQRVQNNSNAEYQVALDTTALRADLEQLAPTLQRSPQNSRFTFNDDTHQLDLIQPAVIGRALDVDATLQKVSQELLAGNHNIALQFNIQKPDVTDSATAEQLGITELIHSETSYFYGSSASRVQNITTAAAQFHGLLVAPGETFSMANALGDITLDNGYAEALIILGGQTIKGVGGGVCQVSTTLFRTAFFSGFPIVERHAHAYRVSYYEKVAGNRIDPNLAGLDATVFVPVVDFKFTNDTSSWLLMETYVNPSSSSITWKFYSTSDGRQVQWDTTGPINQIDPPDPEYKENPDLAAGEVKQVDWAAQGAEVMVQRTVTRNGSTYFSDSFHTVYEPWAAVYEYGPGTEGMPPDKNNNGSNGN